MIVCGCRPEIIRLSETIRKLDTYTDHKLVFTQQSHDYEMGQVFFDELGIRDPDYLLGVRAKSIGEQIGNILKQCEEVLVEEKPDAFLVLGDTNSALSAIVAKRMRIPVFHMEAGNRCFDDLVPEEVNRRIIDHIADINMCYTEHARRNLLREGIDPHTIFVIGSPLPEVYAAHANQIRNSDVLRGLPENEYVLASIHREDTVESKEKLASVIAALRTLAEMYQEPVIFSCHPRTRDRLMVYDIDTTGIHLHQPFGLFDYVKLQQNALCVLSDSGTIHEDAAIWGFPAVNVRESQERPEVYDAGNVVVSGVDTESILEAVELVLAQVKAGVSFRNPYAAESGGYSDIAVRLIVGQCGIVKQKKYGGR